LRERLEAEQLEDKRRRLADAGEANARACAEAQRLTGLAHRIARDLADVVKAWRHQKDLAMEAHQRALSIALRHKLEAPPIGEIESSTLC
jgi:hypothetical protein